MATRLHMRSFDHSSCHVTACSGPETYNDESNDSGSLNIKVPLRAVRTLSSQACKPPRRTNQESTCINKINNR